ALAVSGQRSVVTGGRVLVKSSLCPLVKPGNEDQTFRRPRALQRPSLFQGDGFSLALLGPRWPLLMLSR
ncbi:MAG: hypothetical protein KDI02_08515, partial [Anaerolineae bacterium]|nr:hypothetical protein [Anaerolineae bacterium]